MTGKTLGWHGDPMEQGSGEESIALRPSLWHKRRMNVLFGHKAHPSIHLSVCDLGTATKPFPRFSWNLVKTFFTKKLPRKPEFYINTGSVTSILYLGVYMNSYLCFKWPSMSQCDTIIITRQTFGSVPKYTALFPWLVYIHYSWKQYDSYSFGSL